MTTLQGKLLAWAIALTILDLITPFVPILGVLLIWVVAARPRWFAGFVRDLYGGA
ncbi:MAG: hypothetical protein ACT4PE_04390 [Candidatus Eiseniibacteriota bacterium]